MSDNNKPRVAIFVEAHEGFGHFNIVSQLARKLEAQGAEVMVLSGTRNYAQAGQIFDFGAARLVDLPIVDYKILDNGTWEYVAADKTPYAGNTAYINQRKDAIKEALGDFKPDMVVTEYFPFQQAFRIPDIEAVDEMGGTKPLKIALSRDIVQNANPQGVADLLNKHYDRILVRADKQFQAARDTQWQGINPPTEYMGNYISPMPKRDETIPEDARPVVVFGGGGNHGSDIAFFESVIRSRANTPSCSRRPWHMVVSANAAKHRMKDPIDPSGTTDMTVLDYLQRLAQAEGHGAIQVSTPIGSDAFRQEQVDAAMVITRAGYNTTLELLAAGQRQLIVPRGNMEEVTRANRLYEMNGAQVFPAYPIAPQNWEHGSLNAQLNPQGLAEAIEQTMAGPVPVVGESMDNRGADTTARRMVELIAAQKGKSAQAFSGEKRAGSWANSPSAARGQLLGR